MSATTPAVAEDHEQLMRRVKKEAAEEMAWLERLQRMQKEGGQAAERATEVSEHSSLSK